MPAPVKSVLKGIKIPTKKVPLWEGPCAEGPNGGVTQSMLGRFLNCRERFRVRYVEGLAPAEKFNHRLEYGQMWHTCEEALARDGTIPNIKDPWLIHLMGYVTELNKKYPMDREQINHWYQVCKLQFPLYVKHWSKHPDVKDRTPLFQEDVFDTKHRLPSGRTVRLRGKRDSVDILGKNKTAGIWLKENKTKGDIDEQEIKRMLKFDLQTMMYLVTLYEDQKKESWGTAVGKLPIKGVCYNVVRRPLSGGKGSIKRLESTKGSKCGKCKGIGKILLAGNMQLCPKCKGKCYLGGKPAETAESFYARVAKYITDEPEHYFMRWTCDVSQADVERFKRETLNPLLEQLCDWYNRVSEDAIRDRDPFQYLPYQSNPHWRHPFGAANSIDEYGWADMDSYLETGNSVGLKRQELFRELK